MEPQLLSEYEASQWQAIEAWKQKPPAWLPQSFQVPILPFTKRLRRFLPEVALQKALNAAGWAAEWITQTDDLAKVANVASVLDLRRKDLELSDRLAEDIHTWAIGWGGTAGGLAGYWGAAGLVFDIPASILLGLRTVRKVGACYGYLAHNPHERNFLLGVMAVAGAGTFEEKQEALNSVGTMDHALRQATWEPLTTLAILEISSQQAVRLTFDQLAQQLANTLSQRKLLQTLPALGAIVGAAVNAWYLREVGWAARRLFQERWLRDNQKLSL